MEQTEIKNLIDTLTEPEKCLIRTFVNEAREAIAKKLQEGYRISLCQSHSVQVKKESSAFEIMSGGSCYPIKS